MNSSGEQMFKWLDAEGSGSLNVLQTHRGLGLCGLSPNIAEVEEQLATSGGKCDIQKFIALTQSLGNTVKDKEQLRKLLQIVDPGNSGQVPTYTLKYLMQNFNETLSAEETKEFLEDFCQIKEEEVSLDRLAQTLANLQHS